MGSRSYPWIVFASGLASAVCLILAYVHYADLAVERGWYFGSEGLILAPVPGVFCIVFWMFQRRPWMRDAGLMTALGVLAYSAYSILRALRTDRLSGDMGFLVAYEGAFAIALTLGWSVLALICCWLAARNGARNQRHSRLQPNNSLERTRGR